MPLYVADYMADTAHLSTLEHGAYMLLIMTYWRRGGLPDDDVQLARITRLSVDEWLNVRSTFVELFGNGWSHKRIDDELAKADEKSRKASLAGKRSGEARNKPQTATDVDIGLNVRSTDAELSQPQPYSNRDTNVSLVNADVVDPIVLERDRQKKTEERAKLHVLGNDWNLLASECGLPQIEEIQPNSSREKHALARIREGRDFPRAFTKIRGSPWLKGQKGNSPCTFDWLINPTNFQKIIEGNYDEVRKAAGYSGANQAYGRADYRR